MKMKYILLFVIVLFIGVSSCNDDIPFQDESEFAKSTKSLAVTDSLVMPIILDDIEDSVINIETNNDLYSSLIKSMKVVEAKLEVEKWSGNIPQTRASVEILKDCSTSPVPADNKIFTAKFGSDIINAINDYRNPGTVKLSTKKKYQCRWLSAFTFYNLKENQVGGSQNSPNCGLIPESKEGLVKRGYNSYTNSHNQFTMTTYVLIILNEDVDHLTPVIDQYWPLMPISPAAAIPGYEFIYAIMTL